MKNGLSYNVIGILLVGVVAAFFMFNKKETTNYIKNADYLYDEAIEYVRNNDLDIDKGRDDYQLFISCEKFGISEDSDFKYVYMWITKESYYTIDSKLYKGTYSSNPYKFYVSDGHILYDEVPNNDKTIEAMFPNDLVDKVTNYNSKELDTDISNQVKEHYTYLDSLEIQNK